MLRQEGHTHLARQISQLGIHEATGVTVRPPQPHLRAPYLTDVSQRLNFVQPASRHQLQL